MPKPRVIDWDHLVSDLALNCETYHHDFYAEKKFSGPGLHFHQRALNAKPDEKAEMVYAALAAWGMHRPEGGPQMNEFCIFQKSLAEYLPFIASINSKNISNITIDEFNMLEPVFDNLNAMRTPRRIVALSRILAHYLPDIIAPVDEYTSRFIFGKPFIPDACNDFVFFRDIHFNLVRELTTDKRFIRASMRWLNNEEFPWDRSLPKITHNLIVGKIIADKKLNQ